MTKQILVACLLAAGVFAACGDDSGGGGAGASSAGTGAGAGGGGGGGAGTNGGPTGTPEEQAVACMAMQMGGMGMGTDCKGIEEYTKCAQDNCGIDDCISGACKDFIDCAGAASDPCMNSCEQSQECTDCFVATGPCVLDMCLDKIKCGETMAGGACDQLDPCCAGIAEPLKTACTLSAGPAKAGGDSVCMMLLMTYCP